MHYVRMIPCLAKINRGPQIRGPRKIPNDSLRFPRPTRPRATEAARRHTDDGRRFLTGRFGRGESCKLCSCLQASRR